jgi:hypothetical protein
MAKKHQRIAPADIRLGFLSSGINLITRPGTEAALFIHGYDGGIHGKVSLPSALRQSRAAEESAVGNAVCIAKSQGTFTTYLPHRPK